MNSTPAPSGGRILEAIATALSAGAVVLVALPWLFVAAMFDQKIPLLGNPLSMFAAEIAGIFFLIQYCVLAVKTCQNQPHSLWWEGTLGIVCGLLILAVVLSIYPSVGLLLIPAGISTVHFVLVQRTFLRTQQGSR
jgi:hypothetical protein